MVSVLKLALAAAAALALAACGRTYESPAQHAANVGQPAVGLSSDPVLYDSTGAIVSAPPSYPTGAGYPSYSARTTYYPSYPARMTYYPDYVAGPTYYPAYPTGTTYAMAISVQDRQFLDEAMAISVGEIDLARYAYARANSSAVRSYARQLEDDHSRLASQLNGIAVRRGIAPVPATSGLIPSDLAYRSGRDFDAAYMEHVARDHDQALQLFGQEASIGSDPEIRSAAAAAIPALEAHREMADRIEAEVD